MYHSPLSKAISKFFRQQGLLYRPPLGTQKSIALAALSLALNLAPTGLFILFVIRLLKRPG